MRIMAAKSVLKLVYPVSVKISRIMQRVDGVPADLDSFTIRLLVATAPSDILLETFRSTINNLVREAEKGVSRVSVARSPTSDTTLLFTVYPKEAEPLPPHTPIWQLDVSRRTCSVLAEHNACTIQDVLSLGVTKIADLRGMGATSLQELRTQLALFGYELTQNGSQKRRKT